MPTWVDPMRRWPKTAKWKYDAACHMFGTNLDELHAIARVIGLKREWFQVGGTLPHYDLTATKRHLAMHHGAVSLTGNTETVEAMKLSREAYSNATEDPL